jgi:16S rRNA processing protein RimM
MEDLVLIAKVRKPHGVRGELLLESFTNDDSRFKSLKSVMVRTQKGTVMREIVSVRLTAQGVLIKFVDLTDRDAADEFRNAELLIPATARPLLPEGKAYYDELIGCTVVDDMSSALIGSVEDIMEMPAGDILVIRKPDGEEHLLTMVGEEIKKIDTKKKQVRVNLLEEWNERSGEELRASKDQSVAG